MENIFERLIKNRAVVSGISFALLISIILNGFLVIQTIKLDSQLNENNESVESDESVVNYEAIVSSLERENTALQNQLQELAEGNIEVEEIDIEEAKENVETQPETPEVIVDEQVSEREELTTFTSEFINYFLTRNQEVDQNRRENLSPYLSEHLLDTFVPEDEDLGFDFEVEHGEAEEVLGDDIEYSVELIDQSIYIDEESLGEDLQNVLVYATTETVINDSSATKERSILDIRMKKNDDGLEVNNIYFRYLNDNDF